MKRIRPIIIALLLSVLLAPAVFAQAETPEETAAERLHLLDLFRGIGDDAEGKPVYALEKRPTRCEAVAMLVRLLGREAEADAGEWETPFTDVPEWAKHCVGYAYANGITKGRSDTAFGGGDTDYVSATEYLTFLLRALGYDSETDFQWDAAWELSDEIGLTDGAYGPENEEPFLRGDMAHVSYDALSVLRRGGDATLAETLIADEVFTAEAYERAQEYPYDAETVYEKLIAMREEYPEGMQWTDDESYRVYGMLGYYYYTGTGCVAFAMRVSDAAFGELPYRQLNAGAFSYETLRPGDMLRIMDGTHTAIILEVREEELILAEGNYNRAVHWGRALPRFEAETAEFMWTRYPE